METITSRENQFVKTAVEARMRRSANLFIAEGLRLCEDLSRSNVATEFVLVTNRFRQSERGEALVAKFENNNVKVIDVDEKLIDHVADTRSPQRIIAVASRSVVDVEIVLNAVKSRSELPMVAVLNDISDPTNFGSVVRSAEAAGVAGVILTGNSVDPFAPRSVRASMGSLFRCPIAKYPDLSDLLVKARASGLQTVGAALHGAVGHFDFDWTGSTMLVLGSEASGLPNDVLSELDAVVKIEMAGSVESLNLAVSAGLMFFEAKRQTRR